MRNGCWLLEAGIQAVSHELPMGAIYVMVARALSLSLSLHQESLPKLTP